ncbi:MAG: hypothetical protein PQJ60_02590 [Spirochaetales bacterium]|nr:hypothetical protein [Spirochaetales bacterium]
MKNMKLCFTVLLLLILVTSGLSALDFDYHGGAGVSIPYVETQATFAFPSLYAGMGVNIIPKLALGAEYEVFGLYFMGYGALVHMPRAYVKFDLAKQFTLTGVGGVAFPTLFSPDDSETFTEANTPFVGARATLLFMYGEYLVFVEEPTISLLSLGIAIRR